MAIMLPDRPKSFDSRSLEDVIFESLKKLSDDYVVFHSFSMTTVNNDILHESEADFVIYNRNKGLLCIEAKAGEITFSGGLWRYQSGRIMGHDGPYSQASKNKWKLHQYVKNSSFSDLACKCKMVHAVWFPSITKEYLNNIYFTAESDKKITLVLDDLENPTQTIERIFNIQLPNGMATNLTKRESDKLLKNVLCPSFKLIPSLKSKSMLKDLVFNRLLNEQANVLNYLVDQKTALINGAAGTGKTMIAMEKARRNSIEGEKVLFLCYNSKLKDYLEKNYVYENVSFYTIDALACKYTNSRTPDYSKFESALIDMSLRGTFPYSHVIIDEGQDFGKENIEESNIINLLRDVIEEKENSTIYVFYDALQMVQSHQLPKYILDADCKLTLYKNCRNTARISETSMSPLEKKRTFMADFSVLGDTPTIHFLNENESLQQYVTKIISNIQSDDVMVLTCRTEQTSEMESSNKYGFTTCRKFKGLEADTVIIVDVDKDIFVENRLLFYVGASRAKSTLEIVTRITDKQAKDILSKTFSIIYERKNARKRLAAAMGAIARFS